MPILNLFTEIGTVILFGYLALTNGIADYANSFFTNEQEVVEIAQEETSQIPRVGEEDGFIPRVLLENTGFQQAALIASIQDDGKKEEISSAPLETKLRNSLVNIYCQYRTEEYIRTTTGTGFVINSKGVILTNAHVAQFLLLEDSDESDNSVECIIRNGDPATPKYKANLLYISPKWIVENADLITHESPRGTGERDYALLYISSTLDSTPLPIHFPSVPVDTALLPHGVTGVSVLTAGYPAEVLFKKGSDAELPLVVASSSVGMLYTFGSNYADLFSISDSPVGQQGASGGPIAVTEKGEVIGLIVTKGDEVTEGEKSLRALTLSYIDRTILEETGFSLTQNMLGDVALRGNIFKNVMTPFLAGILQEKIAE